MEKKRLHLDMLSEDNCFVLPINIKPKDPIPNLEINGNLMEAKDKIVYILG